MKTHHYIAIAVFFSFSISCKNEKKEDLKKKEKKEEIVEKEYIKNYLEYTEDFIDKSWMKTKAKVENNVTLDPNGKPNADLIDITEDSLDSKIVQFISNLEDGIYAFSIHLKALEGKSGTYAIGATFKGEKRQFRKNLVLLNDSTWTRAFVKLRKEGEGDLIVYPAYARINGAELNKAYIWGAQLEKLEAIKDEIKNYSGKNVIIQE